MRTQLIISGLMLVLVGCGKSEDPNLAPNQPTIISPADGATCESLKPSLSWEATDPEKDELIYTLWMGTSEDNLSAASDNLQNPRYTPAEDLNTDTKYYWQIEAHDGTSSTRSEVVSFGTTGEGESGVLPSRPVIIAPKNDTAAGDVTFSWNASVGGEGVITYDLYVQHGTSTSFTPLGASLSETSHTDNFSSGSLSWYVEAIDSRGQTSRSEIVIISLD
ncbi:fibronectin type III domain-containing protein [Marinilabilia rubra]|uniref:Fibronectin type-III domain-containing protein n=1 Tax=Marinilabilia rubra TaxID=2162893 RepID=A0A2U2B5F2_9BACT|nr:hypothetical protein [Marinilabilia rubra]PWD98272.1 hypothetical protein DDZ16_16705 [Marinilabilia rubra]